MKRAAPSRGRHAARRLRAWGAACAWLVLGTGWAGAQSAADQEIDAIVAEIAQLPHETFAQDPQLWQEVFDLLEQYYAARRQAGAAPPSAPAPAAVPKPPGAEPPPLEADNFPAAFHGLVAAARSVGGQDLAGLLLSDGMNGGGAPGVGATAAVDDAARRAGVSFPSPEQLRLLMTQVETANARNPNADTLNKGMRDALNGLQARATQQRQELDRLQRVGMGVAKRLELLDSIVGRAGGLDLQAPAVSAAQLTELRSMLSGVRSAQDQDMGRVGAHEVQGMLWASRNNPRDGAAGVPAGHGELVQSVTRRIEALRAQQDMAEALRSLQIGQQELYLAALDALAREESVKAAALHQGGRAQQQLQQVSEETKRLSSAVERLLTR
ncbi:hypothetical protein M8A51_20330 [Schlegelella sp. S2-27]|uniref:LTXXQ motif family protein n=1 Tax=Caldimonas mangrovi TaxID=2944811 RepID=A0ABT0YT11_9BURK|nr:hypothetical protein [Caldimonas mangrovi]MCM5681882.1 hypothetical protein [Caldimonas mangrovi]